MRFAVAGQGWLAVRTARLLAALVATSDLAGPVELRIVPNAADEGADGWLPSLVRLARDRGWPLDAGIEEAGLGAGDVLLSLQYDRVVDVADLHGAAAYNLHFALLPAYRGSLPSALPLRHGATTVGVTLHVLTARVDAGPVVAQRAFDVPGFLTAYELYRLYHEHGFELVREHLPGLLAGRVPPSQPQDEARATTYFRRDLDFGDHVLTDFDRPAAEVRDRVRSLVFPPKQLPSFGGRRIAAAYPLPWPAGPRSPGEVVHASGDLTLVACRDGVVALEFA